MGASQRNKGAAFEKWCANELTEELGLTEPLRRNLTQYQVSGQGDLVIDGCWVIECKRYQPNGSGTWFKDDWWQQIITAVESDSGLLPALIFKYDRHPVRVVFPLVAINEEFKGTDSAFEPFATSWQTGLMIFREHLDEGIGSI